MARPDAVDSKPTLSEAQTQGSLSGLLGELGFEMLGMHEGGAGVGEHFHPEVRGAGAIDKFLRTYGQGDIVWVGHDASGTDTPEMTGADGTRYLLRSASFTEGVFSVNLGIQSKGDEKPIETTYTVQELRIRMEDVIEGVKKSSYAFYGTPFGVGVRVFK